MSAQAVGGSSNGIYYFKFDEPLENSGKPLPVNVAAAISSDPAFEDLAHRDGIDAVINMAKAFGVGQNAFVEPCSYPGSDQGNLPVTIQDCNDMTGPGFTVGKTPYLGNGMLPTFSPSAKNSEAAAADGLPGSPAIALGENPLTPIEQATTFATLADDGVYHTPHVIKSLQQGNATVPLHISTSQVLTPQQAADVDWALSFDNNMNGGTAEGSVSFRRGDVIGKTGTLGSGANASQAWFIGATPDQYALSVALFTNSPATQNLDNLPYANGTQGSQGGAWPATIWNNFMTTEFANTPAVPLFATQAGPPFVPWIQANAKRTGPPTCRPGQFQNCKCPQRNPLCTRPNPTPSCPQAQFGQPCPGTSPNPTPSCGQFGQPCNSPAPTGSPSPTCTPTFGQPCPQGATRGVTATASAGSGSSSRSRGSPTLAAVLLPAEEAQAASVLLIT